MSETVGERRRSKRDEHDERSDSLDVTVAEVDEATLPSLPLPLPLASPSIDYCRVRVIVSTCVRHAQCVCARRTHGPAPFLQHFNPLFPNYSFYKSTYYSQRNSRIMCGGLPAMHLYITHALYFEIFTMLLERVQLMSMAGYEAYVCLCFFVYKTLCAALQTPSVGRP